MIYIAPLQDSHQDPDLIKKKSPMEGIERTRRIAGQRMRGKIMSRIRIRFVITTCDPGRRPRPNSTRNQRYACLRCNSSDA